MTTPAKPRGRTIVLGFGRCGWDYVPGLLPELRLGWLRVAWCRGWLWDAVQGWRDALAAAKRDLGK